jgi:hypothetical protein
LEKRETQKEEEMKEYVYKKSKSFWNEGLKQKRREISGLRTGK